MMVELWVYLLFTALPLYVSNASAMVFGGKTPIDFNFNWIDKNPIFGKGKTWKGAGMGILLGTFSGFVAGYFFPNLTQTLQTDYLWYAFLLSVGSIAGDMAGSFIKRRMNIKRGDFVPLLDQLDFVIGGLATSLIVLTPNIVHVLLLIIITPVIHRLSNIIAYILKMKQVPW